MGPKSTTKTRLSRDHPEEPAAEDVLAISEKDVFLPEEEEDEDECPNELKVPIFEIFINRPSQWSSFLECPEKAVKLKCIDQLYEALRRVPGLAKRLINEAVIEKTIEMAYSPQTLIKAHCFRLLAEIFRTKYQLNIDSYKLKKLVFHALTVLKRSRVFVLLEFSSKLLAIITHIPKIRAFIILEYRNLNYLFWRIDTKDPDVQNNTMQLLYNLVRDRYCGQVIVNQQCFFFTHFFELMKSEYVQTQATAVNIVCHLIKRNIAELNELFHKELGLVHMFEFLQQYKWRDQHSKVFTIIQIASKDNTILLSYLEHPEWVVQIVDYIDFIEDDKLIKQDLILILQLIRCSLEIKTHMLDLGIAAIVKQIFSKNYPIYNRTLAIEIMCLIAGSQQMMRVILENKTLDHLFYLINKFRCKGELAEISMYFIYKLTSTNYTIVNYKNRHLKKLQKWFLQESNLSENFQTNLINTFSIVVEDEKLKFTLKNGQFFEQLCKILKVNSLLDHILRKRLAAANILYTISLGDNLIWDDFYQIYCNVEDFMDILRKSTTSKIIGSLSRLIKILIKPSETLTLRFIRKGCLKWLIQNERIWFPNEDVESLIHTFYHNFLPIKFHYMGHLEFTDLTKNGFYCLKGMPNKDLSFSMLNDMRELKSFSRIHLAYIFIYKKIPFNKELITEKKDDDDDRKLECPNFYRRISEEIKNCESVEEEDESNEVDTVYEIEDNAVTEMVETIKKSIITHKNTDTLSKTWTKIRVKILTNTIVNFMGKQMPMKGYKDEQDYHNLHLHLSELKINFNSSILPIGALKIGYKFERAVLFKCLADIIGLPCRLVRGQYGIAWNEICIVKLEDPIYDLPLSRLVPSHVVDLWKKPGKLLPIGHLECNKYCGPKEQPLHSMRARDVDLLNTLPATKYK